MIAETQKPRVAERRLGARKSRAVMADLPAFASMFSFAPDELSPKAAVAVTALIEEVARLRRELEKAKGRVVFLQRLAHEDALMPVANRRAFIRELSRLLALAKRYGLHSSIVYLDVNGMKAINDRCGHNAGDAALQHVAHILVDSVRHADVVARLGGDEFGVLLVKTEQEDAEQKAASLAEAVAARPFYWNGAQQPLTVAVGAYSFSGAESVAEALERADRAMYRRKQETKLSVRPATAAAL